MGFNLTKLFTLLRDDLVLTFAYSLQTCDHFVLPANSHFKKDYHVFFVQTIALLSPITCLILAYSLRLVSLWSNF